MPTNRNVTSFQHSRNEHILTKALTQRYLIAFILTAIMVTATWITITVVVSKEASIAHTVNVSGRQRMLSQQTALLSMQFIHASAEQRPIIRDKLGKSIKLMLDSHLALTHGNVDVELSANNMSDQIRSMYFAPPLSVDTQVKNYLSTIQELLETPEDELSSMVVKLLNTISIPLDRLLESLDKVVQQYQKEGELTVSRIQETANYIWFSTLLLLVLEGYFLFYPTILKIRAFIKQREQSESQLIAVKEEAERANRAKSEFLSSMSHELRTPMNAILGFSQLIELDDNLTSDQEESLQHIINAGHHLLDLINEVLDLSTIESGRLTLSLEPVSVVPVVEECLLLVNSMAQKRNISIDCEGVQGAMVRADRVRFKQIIINLLSNAIKYNHEGGSVLLSKRVEGDRLHVCVSDTGPGIPADKLEQLFQPFNRLGAENGAIEGTGIGLTITRQIAELMGGTVTVESELGVGSTFVIDLPLESITDIDEASLEVAVDHGLHQPAEAVQHIVLYIEDNPDNLKLVTMLLGRIQHIHLLTAHTPELGIELAQTRSPELILLDINLPGMDGYQVLEVFKADANLKDIPVIAITANAMARDIRRGRAAGFTDYFTKPLNMAKFVATVERVLAG